MAVSEACIVITRLACYLLFSGIHHHLQGTRRRQEVGSDVATSRAQALGAARPVLGFNHLPCIAK